ncbi:MAG: hypothetical protein K2H64_08130 [Desulfovibrio sp.]|nr:hypothetical protein [Desulfovibrio sp.]
MAYFALREKETSIKCPKCGKTLKIVRSCREVKMRCDACGSSWPLSEFINQADEAMEEFIQNVYIDRI